MNIVITGASKGLGKAIAHKFAENGYSLYICSRNEEELAALSSDFGKKYKEIEVHYKACDVSEKKQLFEFSEWVISHGTQIDVLINNAGSFVRGNVYDEDGGVLEYLMRTNLYSAYYLSRQLVPLMIEQKKGHIFNICSIASLQAYKHGGSYSITKYAMAGLSANLRDELKTFGIKVTSVFPGAAYTASWDGSGVDPKRIMEPRDIAEMIYTSANLSAQACVEEIVIRPQLGDL